MAADIPPKTMATEVEKEDSVVAFARLMQHLVVPTFVLDDQRRVIVWNRACERLTGFAPTT
jgi:PAS domain-containing protein